MISFVAHYPKGDEERDGMMQRILAIDQMVADRPRTYIDLRIRGHWIPRREQPNELVRVYRMSAWLYWPVALYLILRSHTVYVHSIYNATFTALAYFLRPMITDMHGVVPEENLAEGKPTRARILERVERVVLRRGSHFIFVTEAMHRHFEQKAGKRLQGLTLPILNDGCFATTPDPERSREANLAIYSGGVQPWQNVELMLDAVQKTALPLMILTGHPEKVKSLLQQRQLEHVPVHSVPHAAVFEYYAKAEYGFVLRTDTLINRVACPTKLVEYLAAGLIPIVIQPEIGDFVQIGYACVLLDDLLNGNLPDPDRLERMRSANQKALHSLCERVGAARTELLKLLN